MSLGGRQINPIDVNLHLQKSLQICDKNSADKILSKKDKGGGKCPPSCQLGLSIITAFNKLFSLKLHKCVYISAY